VKYGALVTISIMVIAASSAFWIYNSYPVMDLAWRMREYSTYPMTIFDGFFKILLTYVVPIAFFALSYWVWSKDVSSYSGKGS